MRKKVCLVTLTDTGQMPVCASQISVTMTRYPIKKNLEEERFLWAQNFSLWLLGSIGSRPEVKQENITAGNIWRRKVAHFIEARKQRTKIPFKDTPPRTLPQKRL